MCASFACSWSALDRFLHFLVAVVLVLARSGFGVGLGGLVLGLGPLGLWALRGLPGLGGVRAGPVGSVCRRRRH